MVFKYEILNSRDKKHFLSIINEQFGIESLPEQIFLKNSSEKLFMVERTVFDLPLDDLRLNNIGVYIGTFEKDGFRFSIEGSQFFGTQAKINILELNNSQLNEYLKGEDVSLLKESNDFDGKYVLIKNNNDFFGCSKVRGYILFNMLSKPRRVKNPIESS